MPDNWAPSNPASPDEVAKALLINGPGMNDPNMRAIIQQQQGLAAQQIADQVRQQRPTPTPILPRPQAPGQLGALFSPVPMIR